MRTLAIDPGSKRVGLAMSDDGGTLATPLDVIEAAKAIRHILGLCHAEQVRRLVIGLPLNMDGTTSPGARAAVELGRELHRLTGLPVVYIDERLSSFQARQQLIDRKRRGGKLTRNQKKARLDALAAAEFLRAYLDGEAVQIAADPA